MKQTKLFLIVAILILSFSCKNATDELSNVIPSSAMTVVHIDTKSLLKKSDYKPLENKHIKELLEREKERGSEANKKIAQQLEAFLQNPNSSGIDITGDCFIYTDSLTVGIALKMNDQNKFKDLLIKTFSVPEQMLQEEEGVTVVDAGGMASIGWTKDKLLLLSFSGGSYSYMYGANRMNLTDLVKKQLAQSSDKSISSNKAFGEFMNRKKDISVFYSYDNMNGLWGGMLNQMAGSYMGQSFNNFFKNAMGQLKGMSVFGFVSFEKGEIVLDTEYNFDTPENEKKYKDLMAKTMGELKGDHLKIFAEKPIIAASINLKGEGLYNYLDELGLVAMINENAGEELAQLGIDIQDLVSNIEGDITLALNDVKQEMKESYYGNLYPSSYPEFSMFIDMKNAKKTWEFIKGKVKENDPENSSITDISPDILSVKLDDNVTGYVGINNNTFFFTNNEGIYKNIASTDAKNNFTSQAKGNSVFVFGNLGSLKNIASQEISNPAQQEILMKGINLVGDYTLTMSNNSPTNKGVVKINDTSANSLAVIVKYIDNVISTAIDSNM